MFRSLGRKRSSVFSGRGGEVRTKEGGWRTISREDTKKLFRDKKAEIMVCTDAAAEGLNFQFCGGLVNYDMPWNPMKVEQRIGRIDRLGQEYDQIRIVNLHYEDTIETDVYRALRDRIQLFHTFVGKLQPILARLPGAISGVTLSTQSERERVKTDLVSSITGKVEEIEAAGFDLDEVTDADLVIPERAEPLYGLDDLSKVLNKPELLPPGIEAISIGAKDFSYVEPGMRRKIRVTTDPDFFDAHSESTELWSPGSPVFPDVDKPTDLIDLTKNNFSSILDN